MPTTSWTRPRRRALRPPVRSGPRELAGILGVIGTEGVPEANLGRPGAKAGAALCQHGPRASDVHRDDGHTAAFGQVGGAPFELVPPAVGRPAPFGKDDQAPAVLDEAGGDEKPSADSPSTAPSGWRRSRTTTRLPSSGGRRNSRPRRRRSSDAAAKTAISRAEGPCRDGWRGWRRGSSALRRGRDARGRRPEVTAPRGAPAWRSRRGRWRGPSAPGNAVPRPCRSRCRAFASAGPRRPRPAAWDAPPRNGPRPAPATPPRGPAVSRDVCQQQRWHVQVGEVGSLPTTSSAISRASLRVEAGEKPSRRTAARSPTTITLPRCCRAWAHQYHM